MTLLFSLFYVCFVFFCYLFIVIPLIKYTPIIPNVFYVIKESLIVDTMKRKNPLQAFPEIVLTL